MKNIYWWIGAAIGAILAVVVALVVANLVTGVMMALGLGHGWGMVGSWLVFIAIALLALLALAI